MATVHVESKTFSQQRVVSWSRQAPIYRSFGSKTLIVSVENEANTTKKTHKSYPNFSLASMDFALPIESSFLPPPHVLINSTKLSDAPVASIRKSQSFHPLSSSENKSYRSILRSFTHLNRSNLFSIHFLSSLEAFREPISRCSFDRPW